MKKYLQKKLNNEKGMTLIELLAVIVIIAIIAAIAIPAIGNIIENSRYSAVKADGTNVLSAANLYFIENADKTKVSTTTLKTAGFLESAGKIPVPASVADDSAANFVTKNGGTLALTTTAITFSGTKKLTFSAATVDSINKDSAKGSDSGDKTIPAQ
ncbi:prepilin-type N-terminal cleavage/methylation domain-containing protein [Planococcus kocurii]|uniref:prepilin-type N-terminal cleavage/methylation domain-containing protein n=1 Tax=Planococcus kocurii TaxID=1374 RepID=UPI003D02646C